MSSQRFFATKKKRKTSSSSLLCSPRNRNKIQKRSSSSSTSITTSPLFSTPVTQKKKAFAGSLGFPNVKKEMWKIIGFGLNYQKEVVQTLMNDVKEERVEGQRKINISWTCPRDPLVCRKKGETCISKNWTNPFRHLVRVY